VEKINYLGEGHPVSYDRALIRRIRTKLNTQTPNWDAVNLSNFNSVDILLVERLCRFLSLVGDVKQARNLIQQAIDLYPNNPRLLFADAVLGIRADSPKKAVSRAVLRLKEIEHIMLSSVKVSDLNSFRKAMDDFDADKQPLAGPAFEVWSTLAIAARRLAERNGFKDSSQEFAARELFYYYHQLGEDDDFCDLVRKGAKEDKSTVLLSALHRGAARFDIDCRR
jgi:hypothetical protein